MGSTALAFIACGIGVGFASGVLGIGGAIVLIPTLMFVFGFSQPRAQGTSIGALVPPIGLFAALQYYRAGLLDVRAAAFIAVGFLVGALAGATAVPHIQELWLRRVFAALLIYVAATMLLSDPEGRPRSAYAAAVTAGILGLIALLRRLGRKKPPPPPTEYYL